MSQQQLSASARILAAAAVFLAKAENENACFEILGHVKVPTCNNSPPKRRAAKLMCRIGVSKIENSCFIVFEPAVEI